ncbi:MORN repeat-containing protein [Paenibacillus tuaregi]|uniref:hypothetical protein n=1 Tax=Paenibacillus tuaregi TaxID=1816681 RepID=UPI000838B4C3|nr:hypothetical protein [Paenibacillus tuaregi]
MRLKRGLFAALLVAVMVLINVASTSPVEAKAKKMTVKYPSGAVYYGETKNGKPSGQGTMTWSKNKVYTGNWVNGRRAGFGKLTEVKKENGILIKQEYIGSWVNDKKEGEGRLIMKSTENSRLSENAVQQGKFKQDALVSGFIVRHGDYDPPYSFEYKDDKLLLRIDGDLSGIKQVLDKQNFFSFEYKKGKVYRQVGVGDEYDTVEFGKFLKSIKKEVKPYLEMFQKLGAQV